MVVNIGLEKSLSHYRAFGRSRKKSGIFRDNFAEKTADFAGIFETSFAKK